MKSLFSLGCAAAVALTLNAGAAVQIEVGAGSTNHLFATIPPPSAGDLGQSGTLTVVEGALNPNSAPVTVLNNGVGQDSGIDCCDLAPPPNGSAWIAENTSGKIRMSFDAPKDISAVRTYTWFELAGQNNARAGQKYRLYGSAMAAPGVTDPDLAGTNWTLLATVDSDAVVGSGTNRPVEIAVSITASNGALGVFRHLLWDIDPVETLGTFYGEFDVQQATNYSDVVLNDRPIHYYNFNDSDPLLGVADLGTPGGNPGTPTGGVTLGQPTAPLLLGNAALFDGANGSFVDLGLFHPGDEATFEAWVQVASDASGTFKAIIARWDGSFEMDLNPTDLGNLVIRNQDDAFGIAATSIAVSRGPWHHLVGVFAGGEVRIYLDGELGSTQTIGGVLQNLGRNDPDRVMIGATRSGILTWKGLIDEVAVYNYALSPERIRAHISAAAPAIAPTLNIERAVLLTWPTFPPGFQLQGADMAEGPYMTVTNQPAIQAGSFVLAIPSSEAKKFYRLIKP